MQKLYLKIKDHWAFLLVLLAGPWLLGRLLDRISSPAVLEKIPAIMRAALDLTISIPVVPVLLVLSLMYLFYHFRLRYKVKNSGLKITSAKYGANDHYVNVVNELNSAVKDNKLIIPIDNRLAGDPIRGIPKKVFVTYEINGRKDKIQEDEHQILRIG